MDARQITLAALAAAPNSSLTRVQAQKLLFLIDRQLSDQLGGRAFNFVPYHYGPYDKKVYRVLEGLIAENLVVGNPSGSTQCFQLTTAGAQAGASALSSLASPLGEHIRRLAIWVKSLNFASLVSAIYRAYPEMRANSRFEG